MSTIPTTAQAWRFPPDQTSWNGHKSLELREVKITPPKQGEVLVKLHAAALNYRVCTVKYTHDSSIFSSAVTRRNQPLSVRAESRLVVAVGEGVTQWKKGDRVHSLFFETWFDGPNQDEHMPFTVGGEAATIPCAALTAWHSFFEKRPITKDSTVLVLGSGGVSVFGAQLAKAAGARVIATTSSKEKAAKYKDLGVDEIINYREVPEWSSKVKELTGGKGVEQVLEVGGQGTLMQSLKSVKREGSVHVIGAVAQGNPGSETLQDLAKTVLFGQISVIGILVGNKAMCERLDAFMAEHKIKPVIDRVFGWSEVVDALDYQLSGSHFGKIVIKID
ncbi:Zinc-binding dehydrogenase [Rhizoctonia solani]|uniref:Zinc-binding dehydrogenase n=2 Tax=Rhizoctonia solani TaxID=456999 RepID=A0A8H8NRU9_9AGAM|nr:Zinc-binding dehydrogenase [Rhizoctonia solani]QRW18754.1 Zinc-binding dehydrogenase [Rhizoctonia solani]